jgi:dTDP-4-dehydrorhamnose 3,5-epimerase
VATIVPSDVIDGVAVVEPAIHGDERGIFIETYRRQWFPSGREMIQGNRGDRRAGALVGLHYHLHQADYWYVPFGRARVVLHDLRVGSATDGATLVIDLGSEPGTPGVEHDHRGYYNPADELGVAWDDPEIAADWGIAEPVLSMRDQKNPRRADLPADRRPHVSLRT